MKQILRAGSLCGEYLVLYKSRKVFHSFVRIQDRKTLWELYCNDIEVEFDNNETCTIIHDDIIINGVPYFFDNLDGTMNDQLNALQKEDEHAI